MLYYVYWIASRQSIPSFLSFYQIFLAPILLRSNFQNECLVPSTTPHLGTNHNQDI